MAGKGGMGTSLVEEPIVQLCPKMNSGSVVYNDWWTLETLAKDIPAIL